MGSALTVSLSFEQVQGLIMQGVRKGQAFGMVLHTGRVHAMLYWLAGNVTTLAGVATRAPGKSARSNRRNSTMIEEGIEQSGASVLAAMSVQRGSL